MIFEIVKFGKNYFAKIVKYVENVYNVEVGLRNPKDERKNPMYKTNKVILPGIDTIRDPLKVIEKNGLREMLKCCIIKTTENKVFDNGTIDGLVVCAIDGTQTFNM